MIFRTIDGGAGTPPEPDWSDLYSDPLDIEAASEEWNVVIRELKDASALTVANGHAIKRLVQFRVIYQRAARQVAESGPVTKAKRTGVPQWNLHWSVMRQADDTIRALEAELGVPPTRRGKIKVLPAKRRKPAAADDYLKGR